MDTKNLSCSNVVIITTLLVGISWFLNAQFNSHTTNTPSSESYTDILEKSKPKITIFSPNDNAIITSGLPVVRITGQVMPDDDTVAVTVDGAVARTSKGHFIYNARLVPGSSIVKIEAKLNGQSNLKLLHLTSIE